MVCMFPFCSAHTDNACKRIMLMHNLSEAFLSLIAIHESEMYHVMCVRERARENIQDSSK